MKKIGIKYHNPIGAMRDADATGVLLLEVISDCFDVCGVVVGTVVPVDRRFFIPDNEAARIRRAVCIVAC